MRDMTKKQFQAELGRRKWSLKLGLWIQCPLPDGGALLSGVTVGRKGQIMRRASLARAIEQYDAAVQDLET